MVTLMCMLVGKPGKAFPVDFDKKKVIGYLNDAIKEKNPDTIKCDANELQLFLAKRGNAWLKDDDDAVEKLEDGVVTSDVKAMMCEKEEMESSWSLQEWFDEHKMPEPATGEIHVLVELPQQPKTDASNNCMTEAMRKAIEDTLNQVLDKRSAEKKKRESITFSELTNAKFFRLTRKLKLAVKFIDIEQSQLEQFNQDIPVFDWKGDVNEDDQAENYRKYVQEHLQQTLKNYKRTVISVHHRKSLLNIDDDRLPFILKGSTDMLILKDLGDDTMDSLIHFPGLRMAIEVKKDLGPKGTNYSKYRAAEFQAIGKLIAIDLKAIGRSAIVLLTDLNHTWTFLWLGDQCIYNMNFDQPSHAFAFMREAIAKWNQSDGSVHIPFPGHERPLKRRKIDDMIPSKANIEAQHTLREMVERYRSIEDELGLDMSMPREIGRFIVQNMTAYRHMDT